MKVLKYGASVTGCLIQAGGFGGAPVDADQQGFHMLKICRFSTILADDLQRMHRPVIVAVRPTSDIG